LKPDRIKIILITVRADFGGGPYHVDILLQNLKDNFDFFVAAPLNERYGFQWQRLCGNSKFFELPFRSFNLFTFLKLVSFIKSNNITLVHSHGKGAGLYSRLLKIFLPGIKVIHTFHGLHIDQYNFFTRNIYILFEKFLNIFTDQFINVSFGEQEICLQNKLFNKSKSRVIYNAINFTELKYESKSELRNRLSLPLNKFIIISVLRLNFQKNVPLLIDIAEQLNQNMELLFLIIGDGELREETETNIREKNLNNINLLGYKSNVNEYLLASNLYLSTSLWEGLPYSLIEAAFCGLPILATDVTGNNEIVSDSENGFLFQLNDSGFAINKILELKKSPELLIKLGENSKKLAEKKFQINSMIDQIKSIYSNLSSSILDSRDR
jgi:glycosyltransferase involved in cell wall biosynthesis